MAQLRFIVYAQQAQDGAALADRLGKVPNVTVAQVLSVGEDDLERGISESRPDAVVAHLGEAPHAMLDSLKSIPRPGPAVFVAGPQEDSALVLRALRIGVREFFSEEPSREELRAAVDQLLVARPDDVKRPASVIAVMGAKGGVGSTFVACQLAQSLQRLRSETVVVDLNAPLGDVALHCDLEPSYTLANVVGERERIDLTYLQTLLQRHASGVRILAAPTRVEDAELIRGDHVERVVAVLQEEVDWIVIDLSRSWGETSIRALDLANEVLLVTAMDVTTLHHTRQHLDLLRRVGHRDEHVHLLANRHSSRNDVTDKDCAGFVGRPCDFSIPNDYATAQAAVTTGRSVSEVSEDGALDRSFQKLARRLHDWCGIEVPADADASAPGLGRRLKRLLSR